jgi:ADP-ribosylglycohydrolase
MSAPRSALERRVVGSLLGVHAGDALGAAVEFSSWASIRSVHPDGLWNIIGGGPFGWQPGAATDDTDLTRCVVLAYLDPGEDVVRAAADLMLAWLHGDWPGRPPGIRPRDVGSATTFGLTRYRRSGDPRRAGAGRGQAGNGSLMRCIATAIAVPDRDQRIRQSQEISAVTHDDLRCTVACAAYNEIAAALFEGAPARLAVESGEATARELSSPAVAAAISIGRQLRLPEMAATGRLWGGATASGYVLDSLSIAIAAALDPRPLENVLVDVVRLGNDTDTNAAIAGGLLGARDGSEAIPDRWLDLLQYGQEFAAAGPRLAGA